MRKTGLGNLGRFIRGVKLLEKEDKEMDNILITGGSGFIGSYVAKKLVEEGNNVVCFDNLIDYSRQTLVGPKAIFHRGDITRIEELFAAIKEYKINKIVALAYLMSAESEKNLQRAVQVNVLGLNNVFEVARLCDIRKIVFASSIGFYGHYSLYGNRPVREGDFNPPATVYSASKQLNEFMAGRYSDYYQMEIIGIRVSIVFGSGRKRGLTTWIDNMVTDSLQGVTVNVPRQSNQIVNLIYVKDLAEIFSKIVLAKKVEHKIYNSGHHAITLQDFGGIIKKFIPNAKFIFDEQAPPLHLVNYVDDSRLRREFQLKDNSLEDNILDQIQEIQNRLSFQA